MTLMTLPTNLVAAHARSLRATALALVALLVAACGGGGGEGGGPAPVVPPPVTVNGPAWWQFGRDVQHAAVGAVASQPVARILWQTPVDLNPQYLSGNVLLIHYGSPVISSRNTVVIPVKTGATGGYRIEAHAGSNGALMWSADSDYILPPHDCTPSFNASLTQGNRVYMPGAGGKILFRDNVDATTGTLQSAVFYGASNYDLDRGAFNSTVIINTPLTVDPRGNVYFGFVVTGNNPAGLVSGIARVTADGAGTWVGARAASGNPAVTKVAMNSAPALSADLATVYVAVATTAAAGERPTGMLLALDAQTLATRGTVELRDPRTGNRAWVSDNSSASPTVGPDGDVFYGVLESDAPGHNFRGWLLHFDSTLATTKIPGSFGWDETVSIVPVAMLPSYTGPSTYLIASKYNNYAGVGTGDGKNRMAVLDPKVSQADTLSSVTVMREVLTVLGVTPQAGFPGAVREWCINTIAVDPLTNSLLVNSEDGKLYRWHLPTNALSEQVRFNNGYAESYTPTAIGPDGAVYAINNATLFSVGR